jgi:glutaredoxin
MAVKLHRCSLMWFKLSAHPCWRVQKALDDAGEQYELVKGPLARGKREQIKQLTGQDQYPVIEFEDGSAYREQSAEMAKTIRDGKLRDKQQTAPAQ